jgi:hypothetical protein
VLAAVRLLSAQPTGAAPPPLAAELIPSGSAGLSDTRPNDHERLFILEKPRKVRIVREGRLLAEPFLDLGDRVIDHGEGGLLGLAFDPAYGDSGAFFVCYTAVTDLLKPAGTALVVERFQVSKDPDRADPQAHVIIVLGPRIVTQHNGGIILGSREAKWWPICQGYGPLCRA